MGQRLKYYSRLEKMYKKGIILIIFAVILVSGSVYLFVTQAPKKEETAQAEINFSETGNIVNWDSASGTHTATWQLVYEKPGAPALKVNLIFEDKSLCAELDDEDNGRRAHVEGIRQGEDVTVKKLTLK